MAAPGATITVEEGDNIFLGAASRTLTGYDTLLLLGLAGVYVEISYSDN
jgi:hypothetical protein